MAKESGDMVKQPKQQTFVVSLLNTENKTWQGTITWLDSNRSQPFRSLLEMITLMDSAAPAKDKEKKPL